MGHSQVVLCLLKFLLKLVNLYFQGLGALFQRLLQEFVRNIEAGRFLLCSLRLGQVYFYACLCLCTDLLGRAEVKLEVVNLPILPFHALLEHVALHGQGIARRPPISQLFFQVFILLFDSFQARVHCVELHLRGTKLRIKLDQFFVFLHEFVPQICNRLCRVFNELPLVLVLADAVVSNLKIVC